MEINLYSANLSLGKKLKNQKIFCNLNFPVSAFSVTLQNLRYWSTEATQTKSFNDFVFCSIRESVLKRVINNRLTGSSWHFNHFLYINIRTVKVTDQFIW